MLIIYLQLFLFLFFSPSFLLSFPRVTLELLARSGPSLSCFPETAGVCCLHREHGICSPENCRQDCSVRRSLCGRRLMYSTTHPYKQCRPGSSRQVGVLAPGFPACRACLCVPTFSQALCAAMRVHSGREPRMPSSSRPGRYGEGESRHWSRQGAKRSMMVVEIYNESSESTLCQSSAR